MLPYGRIPRFRKAPPSNPNSPIVLVHGGEGDAAVWHPVASLLERAGFAVTVTPIPLTSFDDDVAAVRRAFAAQPADLIAVGHSYGGAVITSAAAGNPQVAALVYIAAFAPDRGECLDDLVNRVGPRPVIVTTDAESKTILPEDHSCRRELHFDELGLRENRGSLEKRLPTVAAASWLARTVQPAWQEMPSWYLVATGDQTIPVALQWYMARRIKPVRIAEVDTSHLPQLTRPESVAAFIREAVKGCR